MGSILLNNKLFHPQNLDEIKPANFKGVDADVLAEIRNFLTEWWDDSTCIAAQTSGSTGAPKIIHLSKKTVAESADKTISFFGLNSGHNALLCLPCRFIAGKLMLVRAIRSGMNLVIVNPNLNAIQQLSSPVDFAALIPAQVAAALKKESTQNRIIKIPQVLLGGAPINSGLEKQLAALPNRFFHSYGMTETATHVALREIGVEEEYSALNGVCFSLDDRGCLVIKADHIGQKIATNDLVKLNGKKSFTWLGRIDNAIISGGLKHIPELLEKKLAGLFDVPFYIKGIPDPELGQKLVLVIEGDESKFKYLPNKLESVLQRHEVPKKIQFKEKFKRTENGKVLRE